MRDTLFKKVDYTLSALIHYVDLGEIGLPDIQRPFVWNAAKVRDLFDSMYKGFPVGYLLFWGVLLAGVAAALSILGLASLQRNMDLMVALAGKAVVAVVILAGGLAAAGWLSNLAAAQAEGAGLRGGDLFRRAVFAFVLAVAALVAAAQVGIEISVLVLLAAILFGTVGIVAALALGLGLVPLSGNIAAGRYVQGNGIRPGDEISVNGIRGTVEELGLASVTLRSEDGCIHHMPNRLLLEEVVSKIPQEDGRQTRQV